eukprot:Gb_23406 [translate_table: standard]
MTMVQKKKCHAVPMCLEARRPKRKEESRGQRPSPSSVAIRSPNTSRRISSGEEVIMEECCYMDLGDMSITNDYYLSLECTLVGKEDEESLLPSKAEIRPSEATKKMVIHPRVELVKWLV